MGVQHWDLEEGTVCSFFLVVLVVLVSASLLEAATMFESAKKVQLPGLLLDPAVSSEGLSLNHTKGGKSIKNILRPLHSKGIKS